MCRNIRTLYHFDPPTTDEEIRASSRQFVRKVSGFTKPSAANQAAFDRAVDDVAAAVRALLGSLVTTAPYRNRDVEAAKLRARAARRFGAPEATRAPHPHPH
ncbi:MAG TPA: DUF2277 domain-containing protein [Gemmatimonadales bacterium]|nr:DUF2277 domain-containing protein [Gemmatimonadales bacterium]